MNGAAVELAVWVFCVWELNLTNVAGREYNVRKYSNCVHGAEKIVWVKIGWMQEQEKELI